MQFAIIARDGTDADALSRRLAARGAHMALSAQAVKTGEQLMGAALLNEKDEMCGSVMIVAFEDRAALDAWLEREPYMIGKVWQKVEIVPCKVGPSFVKS